MDESSEENKYKAWFGGEVNGYLSESAEIICLHSIEGDDADSVSETIMKSIKVGQESRTLPINQRIIFLNKFIKSGQHWKGHGH